METYIPFDIVVDAGPEQTERDGDDHGTIVEEVGRRRVDESALALGSLEHVLEGAGNGDGDEGKEQDERGGDGQRAPTDAAWGEEPRQRFPPALGPSRDGAREPRQLAGAVVLEQRRTRHVGGSVGGVFVARRQQRRRRSPHWLIHELEIRRLRLLVACATPRGGRGAYKVHSGGWAG